MKQLSLDCVFHRDTPVVTKARVGSLLFFFPVHTLGLYFILFPLFSFRPHILTPSPSRAKQVKGKEDVYRGDIKYTAQRLYEKGVILEIEGLPPSQLVKINLYIFMYGLRIYLPNLTTFYALFLY